MNERNHDEKLARSDLVGTELSKTDQIFAAIGKAGILVLGSQQYVLSPVCERKASKKTCCDCAQLWICPSVSQAVSFYLKKPMNANAAVASCADGIATKLPAPMPPYATDICEGNEEAV